MIEFMFLPYAILGALVRAVYGIYVAYSNYQKFTLNGKRLMVEFFASVIFGMFGAIILDEIGFWKVGSNIIAILAGLFGANIINILTKKFGVGKLSVNIVEKVEYPELNVNQQRAIDYLKSNGKINLSIYQKLNGIPKGKAKWELWQLVEKGYLKKVGKGKATYYKLVRRNLAA
jgi:hypothetical protein